MGICILSETWLSCSCVPGTLVAPVSRSQMQPFPFELVIPITWMGSSYHFGEWELFCCPKLFWSAHLMESAVS